LLRETFALFNLTNPQFLKKIELEILDELKSLNTENPDEVFRDLCVSEKVSVLQQEQLDWMNLVMSVKNGVLSGALISESLKKHQSNYQMLVGDEGNQQWDYEYFKNLLQQDLLRDVEYRDEIELLSVYSENVIKERESHIEQHKIAEDTIAKTIILAELGHTRLELRSSWTALFHILRRQLQKISEIVEIDYEMLVNYTVDEIIHNLNNEIEFKKRDSDFSLTLELENWEIKFDSEATKLDSIVNQATTSIVNGEQVLTGSTAFPGIVQGKVVVLDWGAEDFNDKINNFPVGDILVAGQTRPMLMSAIRAASAIVTDEGGITSHAAIVAREFRKPCIIGTKYATEILKDGDMIEVDANNGVVRILKSDSNSA
jgi:phosphohistidine swiveling domain-containing protein